jgi:hypothetical protein
VVERLAFGYARRFADAYSVARLVAAVQRKELVLR